MIKDNEKHKAKSIIYIFEDSIHLFTHPFPSQLPLWSKPTL